MSEEGVDLVASERLELSAVERFDAIVKEMRAVAAAFDEVTDRAHAAMKDLGAAIREAKEEVQRSSRDAVRRHLAKESERIAERVRLDIKSDRR